MALDHPILRQFSRRYRSGGQLEMQGICRKPRNDQTLSYVRMRLREIDLDVPGAVYETSSPIWVGRKDGGAAVVSLIDAKGKKRIVMQVTGDGTARLDFFNAEGQGVRHLIPDN
jgi:hypothetical protein